MKVIVGGMAKLVAKFWWIECFVPGGTLIILAMLFARMWAPTLLRRLASLIPPAASSQQRALNCQ